MVRSDILERESEIRQWIAEKQSKAFICKQLQCKSTTLNSYLEKMNIQYDGRKDWAKGKNQILIIKLQLSMQNKIM